MDIGEKRPKRFHGAGDSGNGSVSLLWTNRMKGFANSAMQSLTDLRELGVLCDVRLVGDSALSSDADDATDEGVLAHRCILAANSDYFKAMFTIGMSESKQKTIRIQGVNQNILKKVVDFLYKGCCEVTKLEVQDMITAAAMMQLPGLFDVSRYHLDVHNVLIIWCLADSLQVTDLLQCCTKYVSNHLGVLLEQEEFFRLPASLVHTILKFPKINLGPKYSLHLLRDALRKWMVVNKENVEQKQKLESLVDCEKLGISFHANSEENPSPTRTSEAISRITEFPACFSLIAVMGGFKCTCCFPQTPTSANRPCEHNNIIEIFDTLSLTWVNSSSTWMCGWPIVSKTAFSSNGMFYYLYKRSDEIILYRLEPVLDRWIKVCKVQDEDALARLVESTSHVRAMAEDGEEIFFCGSVRVTSAESGKVAFKINVKKISVDELPNLPSPRYHHGAVVVGEDLFVIGGCTMTKEPLASVLILRKGQKEWEERCPMSSARLGPGVAVLGDYIYAVGGTRDTTCLKTVERYHISSNRWESVAVMACPRVFPGVIAAGGCLFVFGGQIHARRKGSITRIVLRNCEKFDPQTDSWTRLHDMKGGRCEMLVLTV